MNSDRKRKHPFEEMAVGGCHSPIDLIPAVRKRRFVAHCPGLPVDRVDGNGFMFDAPFIESDHPVGDQLNRSGKSERNL